MLSIVDFPDIIQVSLVTSQSSPVRYCPRWAQALTVLLLSAKRLLLERATDRHINSTYVHLTQVMWDVYPECIACQRHSSIHLTREVWDLYPLCMAWRCLVQPHCMPAPTAATLGHTQQPAHNTRVVTSILLIFLFFRSAVFGNLRAFY